MSSNRKLVRSTGLIGIATSLSRVLGFLRDIVFAAFFGTGMLAQAFLVAFRLPNMLRDLVGEGATDAAIVPILSEYRQRSTSKEYWDVAWVIFSLMSTVLFVLSALGVMFAPLIVKVIAPGFLQDPEKFAVTVHLTRWIFPYIFLIGLAAYSKGVLNSLDHFSAPAFAPALFNCAMLFAVAVLCPVMGVNGLIFGVLAGGILQLALQWVIIRKKGFHFQKVFKLFHPISNKVVKLLIPRLAGTAVYQLSVFVDTVMASLEWIVGKGGVAALYFGHGLIHLPFALFGISMATAVLPRMSREVASGETDKLKGTLVFSLNSVMLIMVPAAVGLVVLASPIIRILFQRGEFSAESTAVTVGVLIFYAVGLPSFAGVKMLVNVFYATGDTRTPVKTAMLAVLVNIIINLILMWPMKVAGLALATSVSSVMNFFLLYTILSKRIGDIGYSRLAGNFLRVCASGLAMGVFAFLANMWILKGCGSGVKDLAMLAGIISLSGLVYALAAYFTGVEGVKKIWQELLTVFRKK